MGSAEQRWKGPDDIDGGILCRNRLETAGVRDFLTEAHVDSPT
jgi:hypothetical protein